MLGRSEGGQGPRTLDRAHLLERVGRDPQDRAEGALRPLDPPFCRSSQPFPLVPVDAGLAQDSGQELHANISLIWVRDSDDDVAPDHELMFTAGIGSFESELLEIPNQVFSFDGSERGASGNFLDGELNSIDGR